MVRWYFTSIVRVLQISSKGLFMIYAFKCANCHEMSPRPCPRSHSVSLPRFCHLLGDFTSGNFSFPETRIIYTFCIVYAFALLFLCILLLKVSVEHRKYWQHRLNIAHRKEHCNSPDFSFRLSIKSSLFLILEANRNFFRRYDLVLQRRPPRIHRKARKNYQIFWPALPLLAE